MIAITFFTVCSRLTVAHIHYYIYTGVNFNFTLATSYIFAKVENSFNCKKFHYVIFTGCKQVLFFVF